MGVNLVNAQPAKTQRVDPQRSAHRATSHGARVPFASPIQKLQRVVGNRAMNSLLRSRIIQPKLTSAGVTSVPTSVYQSLAGAGRPLDPVVRHDMEQRFGHDFSQVRVHDDTSAGRSAADIDAVAYTVGRHMVFGVGQYSPGSATGQRLLAHELTHTVQHANATVPPVLEIDAEGSTLEREASHAAQVTFGGTEHRLARYVRPSISTVRIARLQRQRRGAAAGCGICMNDPGGRRAGDIAHLEVQEAFIASNPDIVAERPVPGIPNSGIDLSYTKVRPGQRILYIGEIKPLDDAGVKAAEGRTQLSDYAREVLLSRTQDEVFRMRDAPPRGPLFFNNPSNPPTCPRQIIRVQLTEPGLYQYYCEPPFSQLVALRNCRCVPEEEERDPLQPPVIVDPRDLPKQEPKSPSEPKGKGNGRPEKGNGRPEKGNGKPEKGDGGRKRPPDRKPPIGPQIPPWFAAIIIGLAAVVIALSKVFKPLRLAAIIAAFLTALLKSLGLGIAVAGGTEDVTVPGGPGKPSPGKSVPGPTTTPSGPTAPGQSVPGPTTTPSGPTAPGRTTGRKGEGPGRPSEKLPPTTRKRIELGNIEGLSVERVAVGNIFAVLMHQEGRRAGEGLFGEVILQVTSKVKQGDATTVEFNSVQESWIDEKAGTTTQTFGGNTYTVTHPFPNIQKPYIMGSIKTIGSDPQWFLTYLENVANRLAAGGRHDEADKVRKEIQRIRQLVHP